MDFKDVLAFENIYHQPVLSVKMLPDRLLGGILNVCSLLFPAVVHRFIYRLFFTPKRHKLKPAARDFLQEGKKHLLQFEQGIYVLHSVGQGDLVLLIHGLDGHASDLAAFVKPLAEQGFRVAFFDFPAHGISPQSQTDLLQCARFVRAVDEFFGCNTRAAISYGLGATWAFNAIEQGLQLKNLVCLSPIASCASLLIKFQRRYGFKQKIINVLSENMVSDYGQTFWYDCAPMHIAGSASKLPKGMVVFDRYDKLVPYEEGAKLAENWQDAQVLQTENLSSRQLLNDTHVIQSVTAFIQREI